MGPDRVKKLAPISSHSQRLSRIVSCPRHMILLCYFSDLNSVPSTGNSIVSFLIQIKIETHHANPSHSKHLNPIGPGGGGLRGPDGQTHSCQSETSYPMMPKLGDF